MPFFVCFGQLLVAFQLREALSHALGTGRVFVRDSEVELLENVLHARRARAQEPLLRFCERGVDIGAIEFIHKQIVALRDAGKAVLLVSVELDEILGLADRIAVMFDGRIMGERDAGATDERELGLLMAGVTDEGDN